jgi:cyanate permease
VANRVREESLYAVLHTAQKKIHVEITRGFYMQLIEQKTQPVLTMIMVCAMEVATALCWSSVPSLMPMIAADLSVSHTMGGFIWGVVSLGAALAAPFGGAAADRFGPRRVIGLALFVGAISSAARAIVPDAWFLVFVMFIFGVHVGFVAPSVIKVVAGHVRPERIGSAMGGAFFTLTLGNALTVLTAHSVLAPVLGGWRPLMGIVGMVMAIVAVLWMIFVRDRITLSMEADIGQVIRVGKDRQLMRLTVIQTLQFGGYIVMLGVLPRALTESGLSPARVGIAVALWLGVVGVANLIGPWFSDLKGLRRPFVIFGSVLAGAGIITMALLPTGASTWLLIIIAIGSGSFGPLLFTIPVEIPSIGPEKAGAATGFMFTVGQIGTFLLSTVIGATMDMGGLTAALIFLAFIHFAILIPVKGLLETGRSRVLPVGSFK